MNQWSISSLRTALLMLCGALLFSGCAYRFERLPDTDGKKHWIRIYKDYEKGSAYQTRMSWKYGYSPRTYSQYPSSEQDTASNYTYYIYDTTRIYVIDSLNAFMPLFGSGVLSSRTFYCMKKDSCQIPDKSCGWSLDTGEPHIPGFLGWKGPAMIVDKIEQLHVPGTRKTSRRFMLYASIPCQYGYTMYSMELTNPRVDRTTDLVTFCKTAELTFFEYHGFQI